MRSRVICEQCSQGSGCCRCGLRRYWQIRGLEEKNPVESGEDQVLLLVGGGFEPGWCVEEIRPRMRTEQRCPRFGDPGPRRNQIDRVENEDLVVGRQVAFVGVFEGFAAEDELGGTVVGVGVAAGYMRGRLMGKKEAGQMGKR